MSLRVFLFLNNLIFTLQALIFFFLRVYLCGVRGYPETGVADRCEQPRGCKELSLGSLEEQKVLSTAESALQPRFYLYSLTKSS